MRPIFSLKSWPWRAGLVAIGLLFMAGCSSDAATVVEAGDLVTGVTGDSGSLDQPVGIGEEDVEDPDYEEDVDFDLPTNEDLIAFEIDRFARRNLVLTVVGPGVVEAGVPFVVEWTASTVVATTEVQIDLTLPVGVSTTGVSGCLAGSGVVVCLLGVEEYDHRLRGTETVSVELVADPAVFGPGDSFEVSGFLSNGQLRDTGFIAEYMGVDIPIETNDQDNNATVMVSIAS